jgi:hypothetical protein
MVCEGMKKFREILRDILGRPVKKGLIRYIM